MVLFNSIHTLELQFHAENKYVTKMQRKKWLLHRQTGHTNHVDDPRTRFIYVSVLGSGQAAVAAAGVGAVVAHSLPSARQQEQEQAAELTAAPLRLCVPAPAIRSFSPMELQDLILSVLPKGLEPALGIFLSNLKEKNIEAASCSSL